MYNHNEYAKCNNYDREPEIVIRGYDDCAFSGYRNIVDEIKNNIYKKDNCKNKIVVVLDFYIGVDKEEVLAGFSELGITEYIDSDKCSYKGRELDRAFDEYLTDDRVFGYMYHKRLNSIFHEDKIEEARKKITEVNSGIILVYGVGAGLITHGDIYIFCDLARWEIQTRYKKGMGNYKADNCEECFLKKYKRGFFIEWRMIDKHKKSVFEKIDYLLDTNTKNKPKMVTGNAFRKGLTYAACTPFRLVPYFDKGVWGGQWMKEVCGLDKTEKNYAWAFDGVPEENSVYLKYGDIRVEIPSIDIVLYEPRKLLGEGVHARFGAEFPIRFDFLDTVDGGNLSLQVHPLTEYIQENFGMHYTQDESYYILDAVNDDTVVYLGVRENCDKQEMYNDLLKADKGEIQFDAEKYVNKIPAKKHDHMLIPAGTIHCSGTDILVLEISATPYIFTFKLWDWGRIGLDGLPRPTHIEHGIKNIQFDRDTKWTYENLVNKFEVIKDTENETEIKTGLHEREFIETRVNTFNDTVYHDTYGSVNVFNLVEGAEAVIESMNEEFEPFKVHYAETFIIPASVRKFKITPSGESEGKTIKTIKAFVRLSAKV